MTQDNSVNYHDRLLNQLKTIGFTSIAQFCKSTTVSEKSLRKIRRGQIQQMQLGTLQGIAQGLQLSLTDLLVMFSAQPADSNPEPQGNNNLQSEYDRLQSQLTQQKETLQQEFQQTSLQMLEPWLLQWSAAAYAAQQDPQAPAVKLLPLVRPVENLLSSWGITSIGTVGETIAYDPQQHQLIEGTANPGDPVQVRYTGYRQADRLIHRVKVSI